ncbi:uncharacterized protein FA14DRAFT_54130 [Meira miltonrushii]|uniref:Uncharacterized protein n=1 Tax=Meira miltonrushii TaxID=1280837 RepID=A0A316VH20_9BASI|nr:uncharacterized protein FA14DRAFT_54130 [Meira miltonrushii]PWN36328.1 hypothetical protein FA14DRAFT_54130 [Meira miltonrushii]
MSAATAQRPSRALSVDDGKVAGNLDVGNDVRTGIASSNSSGSGASAVAGPSNSGILCNAHEAPPRNGKMDGGIGSKLKAAFTHQHPGKQIKTNGKPLGKTFHREQPLPQSHAGGEVLRIDPRGPDAPVGDGIVLSSGEGSDDEAPPASPSGQSSSNDEAAESDYSSNGYLSPNDQANRSRSNTASTELSESGSSVCKIKFAPLPSSGRLKRANSITIGVAARSQLLQSQGSGRQAGNAAAWQQQYQQQMQRQQQEQRGRQNDQYSDGSRYSGIQPVQQEQSQDPVDLGEEIRKGASKAWNRFRRGSSVSSSGSSSKPEAEKREKLPPATESAVEEDDESALATGAGEKTPKRSQSPTHINSRHYDDEADPEGAQTPRHSMQRRVSTGAFIGQASYSRMEERRKRGDAVDEKMSYEDAERQNEATQFIEMLGQRGAGREIYHRADGGRKKEYKVKRDGQGKLIEVIGIDEKGSDMDTSSESERSRSTEAYSEEDEDDEETREAEALADQALKGHSEKAMKAGAVEKMEKKKSFGLGRK